jgi:hypothetical protein
MSRMSVRAFALVSVAGIVTACNEPSAPQPRDLAQVLDEVSILGVYTSDLVDYFGGALLPPHTTSASACPFDAQSQGFVCAPITSGGITFQRSYQLLDGSGAPQAAFDAASTAAVRTTTEVTGTRAMGGGTMDVVHHAEQTIGGLLATAWSIEREATTRLINTFDSETDTSHTTTAVDLTLPRPTPAVQVTYPTGTITSVLTASYIVGDTFSMATTFNGTTTATIVLGVGGVTQTCTINLAQRTAPLVCD